MRKGKKKKGKVFQVEGIACAKALRQEDVAPPHKENKGLQVGVQHSRMMREDPGGARPVTSNR